MSGIARIWNVMQWLGVESVRGPLRNGTELLDARWLREEGHFDPGYVRKTLADHIAGRANEGERLWNGLMSQAWLSENTRKRLQSREEVTT